MPRAFEPIAWLAGRPAPHLRLLEPVGLRAGRARRGACARAQMVHVVRHAIGATTLAAARDCVACANSSCAPAQPPDTPEWITSWCRMEQARTSARTHRDQGLEFGFSDGQPPRRACRVSRAGQTQLFAHAAEPRAPTRCSRQAYGVQQKPSARLESARRGRLARWPGSTGC